MIPYLVNRELGIELRLKDVAIEQAKHGQGSVMTEIFCHTYPFSFYGRRRENLTVPSLQGDNGVGDF